MKNKKHSGTATICSNDRRGNQIDINVSFKPDRVLAANEVREVYKKAARKIADIIRELPYSDFGPESTKISLPEEE